MKNTWKVDKANAGSGIAALSVTVRIGLFFDGTGNNRYNSQIAADCRAMSEANGGKHISACKGRHDNPASSYANDFSNVALLSELYRCQPVASNDGTGLKVFRPIYISGIGTSSGRRDSYLSGHSFGRGATGILAKVARAFKKLAVGLESFTADNPGCVISDLELDVFGFSRGAAAARHFINEVLKQDKGPLAATLNRRCVPLGPEFSWANGSVRVKVVGLFDTVAAVGSIRDMGNVKDAHNDRVNLYLPPGCADQILHLVARDEERRNFALNSITPHWSREIALPGAHSDIGGGYHPQMLERVLITRPRWSMMCRDETVESTSAWQEAYAEMQALQPDRLFDHADPMASLSVACDTRSSNNCSNRSRCVSVMAAVCLQRQVFGHLSRVNLRVMHALACDEGVPFMPIPNSQALFLQPELQSVAVKLIDYAKGGPYALDPHEEQMLRHRYIHRSAHWSALINSRRNLGDALFVHAPRRGGRALYPNHELVM